MTLVKHQEKYCVFVYGPTAVGKSNLVETVLAQQYPSEIINGDMGQLYVPLTIGTAKPDWRTSPIPHRLFDVVDEPRDITVVQYRAMLMKEMERVWALGKVPIVVGGSGFYLRSVFYPPRVDEAPNVIEDDRPASWELLNEIDPERASKINKSDAYRIERAITAWRLTGKLPSTLVPQYDPPGNYQVMLVVRDRTDLYKRIDERVIEMINAGWIDEVRQLMGTPWQDRLLRKKLIGYDDIIRYLDGDQTKEDYEILVKTIQQRTRNYAKRQLTFGRMLERQLKESIKKETSPYTGSIIQYNLPNS